MMHKKSNNFKRISLIILIIVLVYSLIQYIATDFIVDFLWFRSLGYTSYFVLREGYKDIIALVITLILIVIFYINFRVISLVYATEQELKNSRENSDLGFRNQKNFFNKYYFPLSIILAVPVLVPVYTNWETVLLFFFSTTSGILEPAYGKDISFYFFSYPLYQLIQDELLLVCSLLIISVAGIYWWTYKKQMPRRIFFSKPARIHLTVLITIVILLQAWQIYLERIKLLYEDRHAPIFFGPGFVEMRFELPLIWIIFFAFLVLALSVIYYIHKQRGKKLILVSLFAYIMLTSIREFNFIPQLIEDYYVKPNPVKAESRYMQFNIDATLQAFGLDQVKKIQYPAMSTLTPGLSTNIAKTLYNIPLWESHLLKETYEQLQGLRPYYDFSAIVTDRYKLGDKYQQVNIAVRELSIKKLPFATNSWENRHLIYTHGYGAVVSPASQHANKPKQWFLRDLLLNTEYETLKLSQPEIYYGTGDYEYAIVPNKTPSSLAKNKELRPDYHGNGGLKFSSLAKKLLLATFIKEENIIFSHSITNESRLLIRRNISERIHAIAPFLKLEPDPVPVINNGRIYWIVDAYTTTHLYPLVEQVDSPYRNPVIGNEVEDRFNYIRNSIKIIVDAYNGSVNFYIVDNNDPIARAYSRAYPTLFKDASQIPKEFIQHLSYPITLFNQQMQIYARYHDNSPRVFYKQNKRLEIAKFNNQPIQASYLTLNPIESKNQPSFSSEKQKFILLSMLTPYNRENLGMLSIAGCLFKNNCEDGYRADIIAYQFPGDIQIEGPAQIASLINQTPEISQQFTLWGQRGSKLIEGRIYIIPVEEQILYVQPIYIAASSETGFPQLVRVIVAMNHEVAIDTKLELAYKKLEQKLLDRQK